ncbi:hypothetical protein EDC01DRAFT_774718 [Geopyxis carbonaria]|nr:hypothetical protein EDC01DRAFT_774718 [Geopyxis carbonaria]
MASPASWPHAAPAATPSGPQPGRYVTGRTGTYAPSSGAAIISAVCLSRYAAARTLHAPRCTSSDPAPAVAVAVVVLVEGITRAG